MLNIRIEVVNEMTIEEAIRVLRVMQKAFNSEQVRDAVNLAIACMRKVENSQ